MQEALRLGGYYGEDITITPATIALYQLYHQTIPTNPLWSWFRVLLHLGTNSFRPRAFIQSLYSARLRRLVVSLHMT